MGDIIYQGVPGAYSCIVAERYFNSDNRFIGVDSFEELFKTIGQNKGNIGVVPIENSLVGSVIENYDLLLKYRYKIIGEAFEKVDHALLVLPDKNKTTEESIKSLHAVISHPVALDQCRQFFRDHPWIKAKSYMDTAGAAKEVYAKQDPSYAAIASPKAGELYQLNIAKTKIQDNPNNYTRFLILSHNELQDQRDCNKLTICIILDPNSDDLSFFLHSLFYLGVKITKIDSRPLIGTPFEYPCFIDLVCRKPTKVLALCAEFNVVVLGLYKQVFYRRNELLTF